MLIKLINFLDESFAHKNFFFITSLFLTHAFISAAAVVSKTTVRECVERCVRERAEGKLYGIVIVCTQKRAEVVKSYVNVIPSSGDVKYVLLILLSRNRRKAHLSLAHTTEIFLPSVST